MTTFAACFKQHRIKAGLTLRAFCLEHGFDPGNISKLERGRMPPPKAQEKLTEYATALKIVPGSDEWYEFFDLAASRRLPTLLAEASGGLVVGPADLADLVSSVPARYKRVHTVRQAEMWNHWALFVCLMIALSLEWILRRRKGLA